MSENKTTKVDIFGVQFDNMTVWQISSLLLKRIRENKRGVKSRTIVFTPNPEIVMRSLKDKKLAAALKKADITAADGVGIVWASKYFTTPNNKIKERASGYDIVQALFALECEVPDDDADNTDNNGLSAFFLGGGDDAVTKAAIKTQKQYTRVRVAGTRNGYFGAGENDNIISQINIIAPDVLLVGLGSPKQERWVSANSNALNVPVIITVGGSFDVMSGNLKRAPEIFIRFGLEWLYRLITQPRRFKRMLNLPLFVMKVWLSHGKSKANNI